MGDVLFVLVVVASFALAAVVVRWCDHLVGPDDLGAPPVGAAADASRPVPGATTASP